MNHEESVIQHDIVMFLQGEGVFCHSVPNEGAGNGGAVRTMQLVAMGLRPGVADLVVWWPFQDMIRVGYVEVKTKRGKQSERQKHFEERCAQADIPYLVVRSVEDVRQWLAWCRETTR